MKITDNQERGNKGYDDKKEFICTGCGKPVFATKFASAKTIKCDECKASGKQSDPNIVNNITPSKSRSVPTGGETKELPCIHCGKITTVSKFMSANKVECEDCKGESTTNKSGIVNMNPHIDLSKINRATMPSMEEYYIMPSIISNPRLRDVQCPACHTDHMKIIGIMDYSEFGLIIHYQCTNCYDIISVSEQSNRLIQPYKPGVIYDYSGNAILDMVSPIQHTRMGTTIQKLMKLLEENNINVDGIELPAYKYKAERPVPIGHIVDINDQGIKSIYELIDVLEKSPRLGSLIDTPEGSRYIQISDTLAKRLASNIKVVIKEDKNGTGDTEL